ncbi:MAG: hypothetical protein N2035_03445 [Chthoniobacterales bacterium]|nr:hypothetical protein [Chthoniobacterales bacterium]MCX7712709.1 hypothetical protein [Chthoniobacterales bacterium]
MNLTLKDIFDVLTFAAFLPEPDDPSAPWRKRFQNRRSLFLQIGKNTHRWVALSKKGTFDQSGYFEGDLKENLHAHREEFRKLTDGGWICVSINVRYIISLESNLSRKKGSEQIVKSNPRSILGSKYEKGKRYAVTHNPESNSSLLLTCEEDQIKRIETVIKDAGFQVGRICVGTYALLRHLLVLTTSTESPQSTQNQAQPQNIDSAHLYIACNYGSISILSQKGNQWLELRSRTDVYENEDYSPILELLTPFRQRIDVPLAVSLISHDIQPSLAKAIQDFFPNSNFKDYTQQNQLWSLMRDF